MGLFLKGLECCNYNSNMQFIQIADNAVFISSPLFYKLGVPLDGCQLLGATLGVKPYKAQSLTLISS